jgi:hypothetical protein
MRFESSLFGPVAVVGFASPSLGSNRGRWAHSKRIGSLSLGSNRRRWAVTVVRSSHCRGVRIAIVGPNRGRWDQITVVGPTRNGRRWAHLLPLAPTRSRWHPFAIVGPTCCLSCCLLILGARRWVAVSTSGRGSLSRCQA